MNPEISIQVEEDIAPVEQSPIPESEPMPEENFDLDSHDKIQPEIIDRGARAREAIFNGSNPERWTEDFKERGFGRLEGNDWLQEDGVSMTKEIERAVADGDFDSKYLEMHYKDIRSFQENPDYISKYEFTDEQGNLHKSATWLENGKFKTVGMVFKSKEISQASSEGEPVVDESNEVGRIEPEVEKDSVPGEIKPEPRVISMTGYLSERFGSVVDFSLNQEEEGVAQPEAVVEDENIENSKVVSNITSQESLYLTKVPAFEMSGISADKVVEGVSQEDVIEESVVDAVEPVMEVKPVVEARPSRVIGIDEAVPAESEAKEWVEGEEKGEMGLTEEVGPAVQGKEEMGLMEGEEREQETLPFEVVPSAPIGISKEGQVQGKEEMGLADEAVKPITQKVERIIETPRVVDAQPEISQGEKAVKAEPVAPKVEVQAPRVVEAQEVKPHIEAVESKPVVEVQNNEKSVERTQEKEPIQKVEVVSVEQEPVEAIREERQQEIAEVSDARSEASEVRTEVSKEMIEAPVVVEKAKEDIRVVEITDDLQEATKDSEASSVVVEANIEKPVIEAKDAEPKVAEVRKVEAPVREIKKVEDVKPVESISVSKENEVKEEGSSKEVEGNAREVVADSHENIILFPQPEIIRSQESKETADKKENPESGIELLRRAWGFPPISPTVSREAVSARGNSAQGENDDATHYVAARDTKNGIALRRPRATLNVAA